MIQKNESFAKKIKKIQQSTNLIALHTLTEECKKLEGEFDNKKIDTSDGYAWGGRTRTLGTPFGDFKLKRRIYKNRHTKELKILFDKHMGLDPYLYIQKDFWGFFMTSANLVKSYDALSQMFEHKVSKGAICTMMKLGQLYFQPRQLTTFVKTLYVCVDGIFINQHKAARYEVKTSVIFTGVKKVGKRNKLINKTLIPFKKGMTNLEMAAILFKYIKAIYGKYEEIVFVGDGARGITSLAEQFDNSVRYIDQFHYTKFLKDLLGNRTKINWDLVQNCSWEELDFFIMNNLPESMISAYGEVIWPKTKSNLYSKLRQFHNSYKKCCSGKYINAIEAIQSHMIASLTKNRRAFSKEVAYKIIMINCAKYNGGTLTDDPNQGISLEEGYSPKISTYDFDKHIHSNIPSYEYGSYGQNYLLRNLK